MNKRHFLFPSFWVLIFGCVQLDADPHLLDIEPTAGANKTQDLSPGYGVLCNGDTCELSQPIADLFSERMGFGASVTGGLSGRSCVVENRNDSGEGSLRACAESGPGVWITFSTSGVISLDSDIRLPSNTTVDGRGQEITIRNAGLFVDGVENIIITHLKIEKANDDAIRIVEEAQRVWIHRVTLKDSGDGLIDITRGSTDVTVSWNRFEDHRKTMLISAGHTDLQDENTRVTIHHNYFDGTSSRHPRVRFAKVHVLNNYYVQNEYSVGCSHLAECYIEGNIFKSTDRPVITRVGRDPESGKTRLENNLFLTNADADERLPDDVFLPSDSYDYRAEDADETLRDLIVSQAGWRQAAADNIDYPIPAEVISDDGVSVEVSETSDSSCVQGPSPELPDLCLIDGNEDANELSGTELAEHLVGHGGNDIINGATGNDILAGGLGDDILNGNQGEDELNGNQGNDVVRGGKDDDVVHGGKDNDEVFGDLGNDLVYGDLGNDVLYGDLGNDIIFGGDGNDVIVFRSGDGQDVIENAGPSFDTLRCEGVNIRVQRQEGNDLVLEMSDGGRIRVRNQILTNHLENFDGC